MEHLTYCQVKKDILNENIKIMKKTYPYKYTILDVSNNAYHHGMYLINFLNEKIDYLYTCNFQDVLLIRKYNQDIKIIYGGNIYESNVYDLILHNVILTIKSEDDIDLLLRLDIKDKFEIIFNINQDQYDGIYSKYVLVDILSKLKNSIHIRILGIKAAVNKNNYINLKYIVNPLKSLELVILNNEDEKNKFKMSNAIILDNSIYGISNIKNGLSGIFKKEAIITKPILNVFSEIVRIIVTRKGKKESFVAVIPFGSNHGMINNIAKVFIHDKLFSIKEVTKEYTLINVDSKIKEKDVVTISGVHNPIANIQNIGLLTSNLSIVYEVYILDKIINY